jgi:molybdenum cofactor guanylyltransferase
MNCYILIGGRSNRMGRSKIDLPFGGSTFLQRIVAAAGPVFDELIAVQRHDGPAAEAVRTIFEPPHEEEAPLFGVAAALRHAAGRCFVLAIDYPLMTTEMLRYLAGRVARSTASIVAPRWSDKLQMLCAGYSASLLPRIAERIDGHRLALRGLADDVEVIEESELRARFEGEPLMNVNTPQELEQAVRLL